MELGLVEKGAHKKKKWVLVLGALGFTCYGAYKFYNLPSLVKKRERLFKLFGALVSLAEMMSYSADAIGIVSKDMKEFLWSDSDQLPHSLKQVSKIASSDEFSESLTRITRAMTLGILRGYRHELIKGGEYSQNERSFSHTVVDKLFSEAGSGFASVVIGSFARNVVMGLYSEWKSNEGCNSKSNQNVPRWVDVACEDKVRELIGDCIRSFVSSAVAVYLDKTMNINTYDEIFSGLTNPKHEARVRDMLVSVCNGALETFIRTSHNVWTTNSKLSSNYSKSDFFEDGFSGDERASFRAKLIPTTLQVKKLKDKNQESGWVRKMSSTLAVPSNRKFVLDMTGIMTFETVRSFLEFLLLKISECMKKSVDVVHHEVVDRGVEAVRFVTGKSSAVTTLCLTLCLNILNSPWVLAAPY